MAALLMARGMVDTHLEAAEHFRQAVGSNAAGERPVRRYRDLLPPHINDRPDAPTPGRRAKGLDRQRRHSDEGCADTRSERLGGGDAGSDARERPRADIHGNGLDVGALPSGLLEAEVDGRHEEADMPPTIDPDRHRRE
jgi:hypothetical protein